MKTLLAFVGIAGVAVLFWFLRGSSDATVLAAKDAQIAAIQETVKARGDLATQQSGLIKDLQDKIKLAQDSLTKNQAQLDADKVAYQRLHDADETIINSLKGDNNADIQTLKEQLQFKDDQIAQLNEKLVQTIATFETQLNLARNASISTANPPQDGKKIYPADDGFDAQDLGASSFTYFDNVQPDAIHFSPPPPLPNHTGWKWAGNSGIASNGAFFMSSAKNGNHDGAKSSGGQAAFLQTQGSWFSQMVKLPAGTYSISFDYEARQNYGDANGIAVSLDGTDLFLGAPTDPTSFAHVTTESITIPAGRECELKFRGMGAINDPTGDHTTFIDNICINVLDSAHPANKKAKGKTCNSVTANQH